MLKSNMVTDLIAVLVVAALSVGLLAELHPKQKGHRDMRPVQGTALCEIAKTSYLAGPMEFNATAHYTVAEKVKNVCRGVKS